MALLPPHVIWLKKLAIDARKYIRRHDSATITLKVTDTEAKDSYATSSA
jgi:hypothetical protein